MRFMLLLIPGAHECATSASMPDADVVVAMMEYHLVLWRAGVLVALDGLCPPSMGARVSFADGRPNVIVGPAIGVKEVLAGFWMIEVASRDEAVAWASRCPAAAGEIIEVRRVQEFADFSDDVQQSLTGYVALQAHGASAGGC